VTVNLLEKNSDLKKPVTVKAPVFFYKWDLKDGTFKLRVLSGRDESRHTAQDWSKFSMFQLRFLSKMYTKVHAQVGHYFVYDLFKHLSWKKSNNPQHIRTNCLVNAFCQQTSRRMAHILL